MLAFPPARSMRSTQETTFRPSGRTTSTSRRSSLSTTQKLREERPRVHLHRVRSAAASSGIEFPKLLGSRLSILYKIKGDSEHPFSEAVGVLQKFDETPDGHILEILKKGGEVIRIP